MSTISNLAAPLARGLRTAADKITELRRARAAADDARPGEDEDAWVNAEGDLFEAERGAKAAVVELLLMLTAEQGLLVEALLRRLSRGNLGALERYLRSAARTVTGMLERSPR